VVFGGRTEGVEWPPAGRLGVGRRLRPGGRRQVRAQRDEGQLPVAGLGHQRQGLTQLLEQARAAGLLKRSDEAADAGPIDVASTGVADRTLAVAAAVPVAVDGERLTVQFPNGQQRGLALRQVQAMAAVRIGEGAQDFGAQDAGVPHSYVLIDLFLDSLWSDLEKLRVVRLRSRDFSPLALVPEAGDGQLALVTLLSNLLASSGAQPLPDAEAACGRPFHAFVSIAEYQRRVLEIG